MPNVFPPILESFDVSLKFEMPDTKETKIRGTATNLSIFTNIVPKGITQSVIWLPIPINTDAMPIRRPNIKPEIILLWSGIS